MSFAIPDSIPRAALVTGGDGPKGRAIAEALTRNGFAVAVQTRAATPGLGHAHLIADLGEEAQAAALPGRAAAAVGPLGVLVNAATLALRDTWRDECPDTWNAHMAINLRAPFVLIRHFAMSLPPGREGVAINLLDRDLQTLAPGQLSFALSKSALWSLTQTLALALAPGIRVNGISGGGPEEIARAPLAILAFRSMTGQMIRPDGVPPPGPDGVPSPGPDGAPPPEPEA